MFDDILERKKGFLDSKITKLKKSNIWYFSKGFLACVAGVSNRVIVRKLEREQKKKGGRGRGRGEGETLARKPHDSGKRPLIFHGTVHL